MAKASGGRSIADRAAARGALAPKLRVRPTRRLDAEERKVWRRIERSWPSDYFTDSDADMLTAYCAACVGFDKQARAADIDGMGKGARMMAMLATKLRLTPQSRYDKMAASTQERDARAKKPAAKALLGGMEDTWQQPNGANPN